MNENEELITRFYGALQDADIDTVRMCYSPDVVFSDPVFRSLHGERAIAMWEMFFERDEKIRVTFGDVTADETTGSGQWVADYTIGRRPVHNVIKSTFQIENGRIVRHRDDFSVRVWAAQALGPLGALAGWSPPVKAVLHKRSVSMLDSYVDRRGD
jgi:limonene-1,2-epoxide hydrolase